MLSAPARLRDSRLDRPALWPLLLPRAHVLADLGQVSQADPIGCASGMNLYAYISDDPVNLTDPSGLWTVQIGVAVGGTIFGFIVPQGGLEIVVDTRGNIGTYSYAGVGVGIGVGAAANGSIRLSTAQTIYDLSGACTDFSVHGGAGVGASADYFSGPSPHGPVVGAGFTLGASEGASGSITITTTEVCGSQGCVGPLNS